MAANSLGFFPLRGGSSPSSLETWQPYSTNTVWQKCCSVTCEPGSRSPVASPHCSQQCYMQEDLLSRGQKGKEASRRLQLPAIWVTPSFSSFPIRDPRHQGAEASFPTVPRPNIPSLQGPWAGRNHCRRVPPSVKVICEATIGNQSERWAV